MKIIRAILSKLRNLLTALLLASLLIAGNAAQAFAHGGEDHGDEKPKVATTTKGIVSRSARLGEYELTLKTPALEPDTATIARLFITKFETNEAVSGDAANPTMEIESSGGAATQVAVEKTDIAGSYNLKIPALPEGNYTVRTNLKTNKGSDTATFSGVEIAQPEADAATGGASSSWLGTALLFLVGAIVLGLFAALFYFAWRMASEKQVQVREETVSA